MNLGTLVTTLTAETSGLTKALVDFNKFQKGVLSSSEKMVLSLERVSAEVKRLERTMVAAAGSPAMGVMEKRMTSLRGTWSDSLRMMSMRLRSFGWLATTVFTFPILMGGKAIAKLGRDYEMAMAKIQGLVGISEAQTKEWGKALLGMAKATTKGPQELADTLYYVASSGFKTKEALNITEMSAKGAATGLGETKDVANFLTSAMNAYRASGLTAARAMDILTASVREGKGEPAEMARALGTILPIASELGVSLDQVGGALAAMTLITSQTANAATYLRNVLMKLMNPSAGTEKALARMGTSTKELNDMLRRQGLMPTLLRLRELTDQYGESMADIFPNIRALLGALNLTGQNMSYNKQVMEAVTQSMGDFQKAFFIASNTMAFRWNKALAGMRSRLTELGITMVKLIIPILEKWTRNVGKIVDWFNKLNDSVKTGIVRFAELLAIVGPLSLVFSTFGMIIGGVVQQLQKLQAVGALPKLLSAGPWVALAAAITAVGIAIHRHIKAKKEFEKVESGVLASVGEEVVKLNYVFDRAKKAAKGTKERTDSIRIINERYGIYLKNLATEADSLEAIQNAQEQVTKAIIATATVRGSEQALADISGKTYDSLRENLGTFLDTFGETYGMDVIGDFITDIYNTADRAVAIGGKELAWGVRNQSQEVSRIVQTLWEKYVMQMSRQTGFLKYDLDEFGKAFVEFAKTRAATMGPIKSLEALIKIQQEAIMAQEALEESVAGMYGEIEDPAIKKIMMDMVSYEKILNNNKTTADELGREYDIIADKTALYNNVIVKLKETGLKGAAEWIKHVEGLLHSLTTETSSAKEKMEEYTKIVEDFNSKMKALEHIDKNREDFAEFGKTFDFVGEQAKLLESTITRLMELGFFKGEFIEGLIEKLKNLPPSVHPVVMAVLELSKALGIIQKRSQFEGPKFDVIGAEVSAYEKAIEDVLTMMASTDKLEGATIEIDVNADGIKEIIPLVNYLNSLLRDWYDETENLKIAQQAIIDQETLSLLQAEADKFGGIIGKVEVLNYALEAEERRLRSMLKLQKGGIFVPEDKIQKAIDNINRYKNAIDDLNAAIDIKYLQDMNSVLNTMSSEMALLEGYMSAMENKLKMMSANGEETTAEFIALSKELQKYRNMLTVIEEAERATEGLVRVLMEGGDETQSLGEKLNEYLIDTLQDLISKLIMVILKMTIFKSLIKGLNLEQSTFGKELVSAFDIGKIGFGVVDFASMFKFGGVKDFNTVVDDLKSNLSELTVIFDALSKGQLAFTKTMEENTGVISFADTVYKALNKTKEGNVAVTTLETVAEGINAKEKKAVTFASMFQMAIEAANTAQKERGALATFLLAGAEALLKGVRRIGLAGLLIGAAIAGIAIAAITSAVKRSKMAEGGIVPPGYPGDTFPALLTSGEAVIPLDRMEKQSLNLDGAEVRFEIEGDRLVGILKKQMKKTSIY